jgi:hypothetical protein
MPSSWWPAASGEERDTGVASDLRGRKNKATTDPTPNRTCGENCVSLAGSLGFSNVSVACGCCWSPDHSRHSHRSDALSATTGEEDKADTAARVSSTGNSSVPRGIVLSQW